jgi:PPOX class probable FMN-dependent enzyme
LPYLITDVVGTQAELRELVGQPSEVAVRKQIPTLDAHCMAFIARSPFLLLGTSSASGACDVSPKGDAPGFALALDERTLVIPDRPGNRRIDSLSNIMDNPRVGLLFLIPGVEETLRVNGRAVISRAPDLLDRTAMNGKRPLLAIVVQVEEAYLHCARSFKRAKLWEPGAHIERAELPSLAAMIMDQAQPTSCTLDELEARIEDSNRNLY